MIKLTEYIDGNEKSHLFNLSSLVIGNGEEGIAHLCFPGLKAEHLRIYREGLHLYIVNLANDPFATLNGYAFRKRKISSGDIIKLKHLELLVQDVQITSERVKEEPPINIEEELQKLDPPHHPLDEDEKEADEETIHPPAYILKEKSKGDFRSMKLKSSLKDEGHDLFKEKKHFYSPKTVPFRHLKIALCLFLGLAILLTVILGEAYLRLAEKSDAEELKAAESLSDIAMALTYAQMYHIHPQKHNWSDPQFIQNNLLATLPSSYQEGHESHVKLSPQGVLNDSAYLVRIYTSNDLSHFLLVAHPSPSLLQWLVPKNTILIDSYSMELRKISDLKHLNRLLANLNTLDGINAKEISTLVKKGEIIPLSFLARTVNKPEFAPPRAINFLKPGAENLIYNAPRYYQFSNAILQKAHDFSSSSTSSHEHEMLHSEMEVLKKLPNLILYTTERENAQEAFAGLRALSPDTKFLLVHLKIDSSGAIRSSEILLPTAEEEVKIAKPNPVQTVPTIRFPITPAFTDILPEAVGTPPVEEIAAEEPLQEHIREEHLSEKPHLQIRIQTIEKEREQHLKPYIAQVENTLKQYLKSEEDEDFRHFSHALKIYEEEKIVQNEFTKDKLFDLGFEYEDASPVDFFAQSSSPFMKRILREIYFIEPPSKKKNWSYLDIFKMPFTPPKPPLKENRFL